MDHPEFWAWIGQLQVKKKDNFLIWMMTFQRAFFLECHICDKKIAQQRGA